MDDGATACEAGEMRTSRIRAVCMASCLCFIALIAGPGFVGAGCGHASQIATAVIDCTKADHAGIDLVEAELKQLVNWDGRYARAVAAGAVIGGCALLRLINPAPVQSLLPDEGAMTFERFRREQAGGASFQTRSGVR